MNSPRMSRQIERDLFAERRLFTRFRVQTFFEPATFVMVSKNVGNDWFSPFAPPRLCFLQAHHYAGDAFRRGRRALTLWSSDGGYLSHAYLLLFAEQEQDEPVQLRFVPLHEPDRRLRRDPVGGSDYDDYGDKNRRAGDLPRHLHDLPPFYPIFRGFVATNTRNAATSRATFRSTAPRLATGLQTSVGSAK